MLWGVEWIFVPSAGHVVERWKWGEVRSNRRMRRCNWSEERSKWIEERCNLKVRDRVKGNEFVGRREDGVVQERDRIRQKREMEL